MKNNTSNKNNHAVNFVLCPINNITPSTISNTIMAMEKNKETLLSAGKSGARNLKPVSANVNSNSVKYVMKNGRLYDAATLDQIAPLKTKMTTPWWLALEPVEGGR